MQIAIDLYAAQAVPDGEDGRFVLELASALLADPQGHAVILLLDASQEASAAFLRTQFAGLCAPHAIRNWWPVPPHGSAATHGPWLAQANAALYAGMLESLQPDAVYLSDPLHGRSAELVHASQWLPQGMAALVRTAAQLRLLRSTPPVRSLALDTRAGASIAAAAFWSKATALMAGPSGAMVAGTAPAGGRPRLAYVSPVPPVRSGIADYSAMLLAALAGHYDIDVVTDQAEVDAAALPAGGQVRTPQWFMEHGGGYDRVVYHFGNSPFHAYMPALCERFPGVVFLHDFFLGDLLWSISYQSDRPAWYRAYYQSHGYSAVRDAASDDIRKLLATYPVTFGFLRNSRGVVVHSEHARTLAAAWLPPALSERFHAVPLIRPMAAPSERAKARAALGIPAERFVLCCFGHIGKAKGNLEIVQAWSKACLQAVGGCELVFVGANEGGEYGQALAEEIEAANAVPGAAPVRIVGWTSAQDYGYWLDSADAAVQLRTLSRGESSAAALDCMNHGLPTVVNRNGSLAELPADAVYFVDADVAVPQLAAAFEALGGDAGLRERLSAQAAAHVHAIHNAEVCGEAATAAIEATYRQGRNTWHAASERIAALPGFVDQSDETLAHCGNAIAHTLPTAPSAKRLLLDISAVCRSDLRTGIQRVVRALLLELIEAPPPGYRIEPVYISDHTGQWSLHRAQRYASRLLGISNASWVADALVESTPGDVFLGLDFSAGYVVEGAKYGLFDRLRQDGVRTHFVVYDLLPILRPDVFPSGMAAGHEKWLRIVLQSESIVCISHAVAGELRAWAREHVPLTGARITAFHLGADVASSAPSLGMPSTAPAVLDQLAQRPTLLIVGTVEPRKGVSQALAAFDQLWHAGREVNLVLIGKAGWHVEELTERLRAHPERDRQLFWLEGISDEYLEAVYSAVDGLLAPSEGEGFGLPLIEAAQKKLPILARDIPVFREVAGEHAFYFSGALPQDLARAIEAWLALHAEGKHPHSENMPWLTWRQSALQLRQALDL